MTHEQEFFQALKDIFIGAPVEGESGYINLMRIKARYFEQGIAPRLRASVAPQSGIGMRFDYAMHDERAVVGIALPHPPPYAKSPTSGTLVTDFVKGISNNEKGLS